MPCSTSRSTARARAAVPTASSSWPVRSTIEGLVIANFGSQSSAGTGGNGIVLETAGGNVVAGNFIGTNSAGTGSRTSPATTF